MPKSKVENVTDTIRRLVWETLARKWLEGLMLTVPVLGLPIIRNVVLYLFETYVLDALFQELARWGVFQSIEWKNEAQYNKYKSEALKLVEAQALPEWPAKEREAFKNAARELIHFNIGV
jgi:hypothetical protein